MLREEYLETMGGVELLCLADIMPTRLLGLSEQTDICKIPEGHGINRMGFLAQLFYNASLHAFKWVYMHIVQLLSFHSNNTMFTVFVFKGSLLFGENKIAHPAMCLRAQS